MLLLLRLTEGISVALLLRWTEGISVARASLPVVSEILRRILSDSITEIRELVPREILRFFELEMHLVDHLLPIAPLLMNPPLMQVSVCRPSLKNS